MALTGNWTDAEEVIQEAVVRTVRAQPRLVTEQDAHNYILTAVRTASLKLFERRRRLRAFADAVGGEPAVTCSGPLSTVLAAEEGEVEARLVELALHGVRQLEPLQRQAVELLILRDPPLRLREVAELQGAPLSTVHSRLRAALRQLGRRLRDASEM